MLKPLMAKYNVASPTMPVGKDGDPFSVPTDCQHRILAVEPRNPASPPKTLKIHRQRTVSLISSELFLLFPKGSSYTRFLPDKSIHLECWQLHTVLCTFNAFHMEDCFTHSQLTKRPCGTWFQAQYHQIKCIHGYFSWRQFPNVNH